MFKTRSLSFGRPTALFPRVLNARFASEAGLPILPHVARASDLHPCFPGCFPLGHATSEKFWISRFSRFAWCIHMLERHGETKYIESIFPAMPQPGTSSGMLDDVVFATWLKPRHVALPMLGRRPEKYLRRKPLKLWTWKAYGELSELIIYHSGLSRQRKSPVSDKLVPYGTAFQWV